MFEFKLAEKEDSARIGNLTSTPSCITTDNNITENSTDITNTLKTHGNQTIETPNFLLYTSHATVPHLTSDSLQLIKDLTRAIQVSYYNTHDTFDDSLINQISDAYGKIDKKKNKQKKKNNSDNKSNNNQTKRNENNKNKNNNNNNNNNNKEVLCLNNFEGGLQGFCNLNNYMVYFTFNDPLHHPSDAISSKKNIIIQGNYHLYIP